MGDTTPVIAAAYRTTQSKEDGVFSEVRSEDLSIPLINEILTDTGLAGDDIGDEISNGNGGAIALGHPLGASGVRLPVTLVHEMNKRETERGLATECVGFGQGAATESKLI